MPWINVIANASLDFWCRPKAVAHLVANSQQNALAVAERSGSDAPHEVLYLRDEDGGDLWSATALPIRAPSVTYTARHGKGYSRFVHVAHGIDRVAAMRARSRSIKLSRLRIRNDSTRATLVRHCLC
jgi:cyclic beta-1,2-glucan synthetase